MALASLQKLKPAHPRRFVPRKADLGNWNDIAPLFDKLEAEAAAATSPAMLAKCLFNASELAAALEEEGAKRYINMTCQTDSKAIEKSYLEFVEKLDPQAKPRWHALKSTLLKNPAHERLPAKRYYVFLRSTRNDVALFRPENVPLQVEESKLEQKYQKISAAMTVRFEGRDQTLQQMGLYMEMTDRPLRQKAWEKIAARRLKDRTAIEAIYDQLLVLREKIARNAGLKDYREYAFRAKGRFDYSPKECYAFHEAVETQVVPLAKAIQERRKELLGVDTLRPWDIAVDAHGRKPLRPFKGAKALVETSQRIFKKVDPALAKQYGLLIKNGLLDLESRKGKAPGGYQCSLEEAGLPFIFMNAVGLQRDVETMLHEAGHAFHALEARDEPLVFYRQAPMEFCEVASMSMELLGAPHLTEFYSEADAQRARRTHLENIIGLLPWIATIDAFQHWIYTHPGHTPAQRQAYWLELQERFGGIVDYSGYENARACMWHRQGHLFGAPFYYIEYGIAQLGALQLWLKSKKNLKNAVANYRKALALGGSRPLPELFKAAKIRFDFGPKTVQPLMAAIQKELAAMPDA
jgi:oligoendopeptidase F